MLMPEYKKLKPYKVMYITDNRFRHQTNFEKTFNKAFESILNDFDGILDKDYLVTKNENEVILEMDMPGISKDELNIEIDEGKLVITAKNEKRNYSRTFNVTGLNTKNIDATLINGVLSLTFPKPKKESKKVNVKVK